MNQIVRHDRDFHAAESLGVRNVRLVPVIPARRPYGSGSEAEADVVWRGWLSWIAKGFRLHRSYRRTLAALDGLSHEQLKDIGFRRISGERGDYERVP